VGRELERGQDYQIIESISQYREADGSISSATNALTILATGMFYWENGQLVPSREEIEMTADGPVALQGPHQVRFPSDIASGQPVELVNSGQTFRSRLLGLSYYNPVNGQCVWVAEAQSSQAELLAPNRVVYRNAFGGLNADVLYEYRKGSFSQDVVLRATRLPAPAEVGVEGATVLLEVVTEFLEAPPPRQERRTVQLGGGLQVVDDVLDFGQYQVPPGTAFWLDEGDRENPDAPPLRMFKRWEVLEGRRFLFEDVELSAVEALLASRVKAQASVGGGQRSEHSVFSSSAELVRALPAKTPHQTSKYAAAAAASPIAHSALRTPHSALPLALNHSPGLVLDWTLLLSTNNFTFKGDTTYYVSGQVNLTGTNTIEGGTVVKFTNTASAKISFSGKVLCQTGPYWPAIFTAKDDNTVGETIPGSTGSPTNYYGKGLWLSGSGHSLKYLHIRFADTAVSPPSHRTLELAHCQFVGVGRAVSCDLAEVRAANCLFHRLQYVVSGEKLVLRAQHLTVHQCGKFLEATGGYPNGDLYVTNSLLFAVTNGWGNYNTLTLCGPDLETSEVEAVFTNVVAGAHYLVPYTDYWEWEGSTEIGPWLLADLAKKTTYPPVVLSNNFTAKTSLQSHSSWRDATNNVHLGPHLGYHYDPLDYCWGGLNLTNASTLVLTNGVAVGIYGAEGTTLWSGTTLQSVGTATLPNHLVRYQTVQEQPTPYGTSGSTMGLVAIKANLPLKPAVSFRYTEMSLPANTSAKRLILDRCGTDYTLATLDLRDCQVCGGSLDLCLYPVGGDTNVMTVPLTNNVFQRVYFTLEEDTDYQRLLVCLRNNLFFGGRLSVGDWMNTRTWSVRDNLFDTVNLSGGDVASSNNGYYNTSTNLGGFSNVVLTATDYQAGPMTNYWPLGNYYYPNTGVSGGLTNLIDKGSTNAAAAGLYMYTTVTNQVPEGNTTVDIGYHYEPSIPLLVVKSDLPSAVDVDYHWPSNSLILSVNYGDAFASNFVKLDANLNVTYWSGAKAFGTWEVPMTTATNTANGFTNGETWFGTWDPDRVARVRRISAGGLYSSNWVVNLTNEGGCPGGLYIDPTGLFGGDLIVVTGWLLDPYLCGGVWRINGQTHVATNCAYAGTCLEGVLVCPNDTNKYDTNFAGKILAGEGVAWLVFTVSTNGGTSTVDLGISPHDFHIIPPNQDFYYLDFGSSTKLVKIPRDFFANMIGDMVVVQCGEWGMDDPLGYRDSTGQLFVVHWTGTTNLTVRIPPPNQDQRTIEHSVFAPISLPVGQ
jgi:hypothetical protein